MMPPTMDALFALEPLGNLRFLAPVLSTGERRVFGGILLGQTLAAAAVTVDQRGCHSLHVLFLAAARVDQPLEFTVRILRDGRRFSARQVEAWQGDRLILSALASFHNGDEGPAHAIAMPAVSPPESLPDSAVTRAAKAAASGKKLTCYAAELLLDTRLIESTVDRSHGVAGRRALWFRARTPIAGPERNYAAALALASDMGLVHTGLQPHVGASAPHQATVGDPLESASLDHAIWFHQAPPVSDWLLHVQHAPVAADGRGWSRGHIFARDGALVATTAQELLMRRSRSS